MFIIVNRKSLKCSWADRINESAQLSL